MRFVKCSWIWICCYIFCTTHNHPNDTTPTESSAWFCTFFGSKARGCTRTPGSSSSHRTQHCRSQAHYFLPQFAQNCIGARIFSRWHGPKCNHMGSAGSCRSGHLLCEFGPQKGPQKDAPGPGVQFTFFCRHARRGSVKAGPFVSAVTPDRTPCH